MVYKMTLLCLLLAVGCSSMASARTLQTTYATDPTSCHIYSTCGWTPTDCPSFSAPTSETSSTLIVDAVVTAVTVGSIDARAAIVASAQLLASIDVNLCASVLVALIAAAEIGVSVVAGAFLQVVAILDGSLVAKLVVGLGADVLVSLCVALGVQGSTSLHLSLAALVQINVSGYVEVLAGCYNGLYVNGEAWVSAIANVLIQVGVGVCGPVIKVLAPKCLSAILGVSVNLTGGPAFLCACKGIGINVLGIIGISIGLCLG